MCVNSLIKRSQKWLETKIPSKIKYSNPQKYIFFLILTVFALLVGKSIVSEYFLFLLFILFSIVILYLYFKRIEFFILLILVIDEELFFLLPKELLGKYNYRGLLYVILLIILPCLFLIKNKKYEKKFIFLAFALLLMILIASLNTLSQGQPLALGLKAELGYYNILFYFVFASKKIDMKKLFTMIIIAGVVLCILNNLQYIFFGSIKIFNYYRSVERAGVFRYLVGEIYIYFSSIIAFGEYLSTKKKRFLIAFVYILVTLIVQIQIRASIWGFTVMILTLLYLTKKINIIKAALITVPLVSLFIWFLPAINSTFVGKLFDLTKYEISQKTGNVGIRFDAYDYYLGEIVKSPIIGGGIWNYAFKENPEHKQYIGLFLDDIGVISFLFHFGLMGLIWILILFIKIYKISFYRAGKLKENIPYGVIGYFIYSLAIMPTVNCFVRGDAIVYLALLLALLSQSDLSNQIKSSQINGMID